MTITELINILLTHNISPDAEIYIDGVPAKKHGFYFKGTEYPDETSLCYRIELMS